MRKLSLVTVLALPGAVLAAAPQTFFGETDDFLVKMVVDGHRVTECLVTAKRPELATVITLAKVAGKRAAERADERTCFANQKTIAGAIDMYNMDHAAPSDKIRIITPETMDALYHGGYILCIPQDPGFESDSLSHYSVSESGQISCAVHGDCETAVLSRWALEPRSKPVPVTEWTIPPEAIHAVWTDGDRRFSQGSAEWAAHLEPQLQAAKELSAGPPDGIPFDVYRSARAAAKEAHAKDYAKQAALVREKLRVWKASHTAK